MGLSGWPAGGPANLLAKWEGLVYRANQYDAQIGDQLGDFCHVCVEVPDLSKHISTIQTAIREDTADKYTQGKLISIVLEAWEDRKRGLALRFSKPKATRSAFATHEVAFNGDEAPDASNAPEAAEAASTATVEKPKQDNPQSKNRGRNQNRNNRQRGRGGQGRGRSRSRSRSRSRFPRRRSWSRRRDNRDPSRSPLEDLTVPRKGDRDEGIVILAHLVAATATLFLGAFLCKERSRSGYLTKIEKLRRQREKGEFQKKSTRLPEIQESP